MKRDYRVRLDAPRSQAVELEFVNCEVGRQVGPLAACEWRNQDFPRGTLTLTRPGLDPNPGLSHRFQEVPAPSRIFGLLTAPSRFVSCFASAVDNLLAVSRRIRNGTCVRVQDAYSDGHHTGI